MNERFVDRWTAGHFALGMFLAYVKFPFEGTVVVAVGWELIEPILKERFPAIFPHPQVDSNANKVGDVLAVLLGYTLVRILMQE